MSVCVTSYRPGPWASYRDGTGIIRTSMTWTGDFRKKSRKVTSSQITEKVAKSLDFLMVILYLSRSLRTGALSSNFKLIA